MPNRPHPADHPEYGQILAHRLRRAHIRATRHPNSAALLLGPSTVAAAGAAIAFATGDGTYRTSATIAAAALLALAALQHHLRSMNHLPRVATITIHRRNLARGHGNLQALHQIARTACEAEEDLIDPDWTARERRAALSVLRATRKLNRLLDLQKTIGKICPKHRNPTEHTCCAAHAARIVPLTAADTRRALNLGEPKLQALRTLLQHALDNEEMNPTLATQLVDTLENIPPDAIGSYNQTLHSLHRTWSSGARELAETTRILS